VAEYPTLDEARGKGLFHPNAVLGNQLCVPLGAVENAARGWYEGPSIHLTTSGRKGLTVSPNHPVLTTTGWLAADRLREGMYVLSYLGAERHVFTSPAAEDLDHVPALFEEVFDALAAHGACTLTVPAGDDFHGDGRFYKGEVSVVWPNGTLLDVIDPQIIEKDRELVLMAASVKAQTLPSSGSLLSHCHAVFVPVAWSLSDGDASCLETTQEGAFADSELLREIAAGFSCDVASDEVVYVERDWFMGHAYDLQTTSGAYLVGGIVVHNCRHSISLYQEGVTRPMTNTEDPEGYRESQKLRYYQSRKVREQRRRAVAFTPDAKRASAQRMSAIDDKLKSLEAPIPSGEDNVVEAVKKSAEEAL